MIYNSKKTIKILKNYLVFGRLVIFEEPDPLGPVGSVITSKTKFSVNLSFS